MNTMVIILDYIAQNSRITVKNKLESKWKEAIMT